jgi:hypothetical protein
MQKLKLWLNLNGAFVIDHLLDKPQIWIAVSNKVS